MIMLNWEDDKSPRWSNKNYNWTISSSNALLYLLVVVLLSIIPYLIKYVIPYVIKYVIPMFIDTA
jgi:membrane protein YdbS with pleckstrin-like domain